MYTFDWEKMKKEDHGGRRGDGGRNGVDGKSTRHHDQDVGPGSCLCLWSNLLPGVIS